MAADVYRAPRSFNDEGDKEPAEFVDRRGRVRAVGVLDIVLGGLVALASLFSLLPLALGSSAGGQTASYGATLNSFLVYAVMAASFIVVGVGALRCRRWVRPVLLAINWPMLVFGIVVTGLIIWILPQVIARTLPVSESGGGAAIRSIVVGVGVSVAFVAYVVIPGLHVLLFQSKDVQRTCDALDRRPRWTDGKPTAVVALAIWLCVLAWGMIGTMLLRINVSFGVVLTGIPAVIASAVFAGLMLYVARSVYRQRMSGWWGALAAFLIVGVGTAVTLSRNDLMAVYVETGIVAKAQVSQIEDVLSEITNGVAYLGAIWALTMAGVLVAIRKHFGGGASGDR